MDNNNQLKVVIAECSVIIRSGLTVVLKRLSNLNIHPIEISEFESLKNFTERHNPDIIIINPNFGGWFDIHQFKSNFQKCDAKFVALVCNIIDQNVLKEYDEQISMCDETATINEKLNKLACADDTEECGEENKENEQEALSQREKEIITCVVKGMTNKNIAEQLFLSIHTVITHRRNIARKLQIHSPAGLTIYAIVNKLVDIHDIKESL